MYDFRHRPPKIRLLPILQIKFKRIALGTSVAMSKIMKSVSITVQMCPQLAKLTGWKTERAIVNNGCPFLFFFECLLLDYPLIRECYPPDAGLLAFTVNGSAPADSCLLKDGDKISFWIQGGVLRVH